MTFTSEEMEKVRNMLTFLVRRKHVESGGHCGFHPNELIEIMDELVDDGIIKSRDTIKDKRYFLIPNKNEVN
ncbi:MAG: hypothetical protein CMD31_00055 [Flavobacteriales bacterium]|mgnify:CR=1 FL=1|nr:hypothetical protein [Flavobacteriales bacterium]|tara:strand:- start:799 stop:1014 length:216 start_codon:yes stop_codon:yes gene_type:complete